MSMDRMKQGQTQLERLKKMAQRSDATLMITGPTGTGKTSLARQIHLASERRNKPFIVVNLASLHEGTIESELFGHERGAFTGADQRRVGRLELAQGGTVFLDEVGELPMRLQARLLDFIQSRRVIPVGGNREVQLDVRVIAATHRDIWAAVEKGEFREDLLHRLCVISIELSALKERGEELGDLIHGFLDEFSQRAEKPVYRLSSAVAEFFETYDWPGNLRELKNVIEYSVLSCEGGEITLGDLPDSLIRRTARIELRQSAHFPYPIFGTAEVPLSMSYQETITRFDREYLTQALRRNAGRINRTARQIGMNKTTLLRRIKAYGIDVVG
jgi:hypothetical protein